MLSALKVLLKYYCFWLLFFFIDRLIFVLVFRDRLAGVAPLDIARVFTYGMWMDASMAGYITAVPLLVFITAWIFPKIKIPVSIPRIYTKALIIIFSILCAANFNIYREWGAKINFHAFEFLFSGPGEALASAESSPLIPSILCVVFQALISFWLAKVIIEYRVPKSPFTVWKILAALLFMALNFMAIRGNWGVAPMNESMAYFSNKPFLNHAAVNTEWSLFHDFIKNKDGGDNPFEYYKPDEAKKIVAELYPQATSRSEMVLSAGRPNVVVFIVESFTSDVIESLGGEKGITPNMQKLIGEGILFNNIYASGDRTEKGVASVISAFPAQAIQSIMKDNNKQEKLPSITQVLAETGYKTSFYYGGESEFANMKSWVLSHGYQRLVDKHAYAQKDMNSKWGAYDEVVLRTELADINKEKEPFFSTILTLSNHEPFELPGKLHFGNKIVENKFRSTSYYTDSVIADYITQAKKQSWYKNTLFILVADHGHRLPLNKYDIYDPHRFRIPLLFFGEVIKPEFRGKKVAKIGSQTDIASTLLHQLNLDASRFGWSKDLLNPGSKDFAFYNWDNGFGFATPGQIISFDNVGQHLIYKQHPDVPADSLLRYGKAYMGAVYGQYLEY